MTNKTEIKAEPDKQELFIIREFDAPRKLVFRAYAEPELYAKWVGPNDLAMTIEKMDVVDGGSYRFIHERDGQEYAFHGVYHEVLANERIIGTFEFDGLPEKGHVILGTTRFEDLPNGRSRIAHQSVFQTVEDRDGMLQSGMERGVSEGYEKLDHLLGSMKDLAGTA
ncbi:MAG TPA: SRPBCC family protein [Pyrinomonadaceae bacterium]|nr:SRPBCC family protein [Pyrinomonadaceae bacterium]